MNNIETPLNEIIGLETTIFDSKNKQLIGLYGKIIFETKNMIEMKTDNEKRKIPKAVCSFMFENYGKKIKVEGNRLIKRSHERLECYS
jgi:ribonuclease P protein subunit POP4|tara:strand:+ start:1870 stop:2133 length:264 start_codon:yes stop_codon:yes gene_type:complete